MRPHINIHICGVLSLRHLNREYKNDMIIRDELVDFNK